MKRSLSYLASGEFYKKFQKSYSAEILNWKGLSHDFTSESGLNLREKAIHVNISSFRSSDPYDRSWSLTKLASWRFLRFPPVTGGNGVMRHLENLNKFLLHMFRMLLQNCASFSKFGIFLTLLLKCYLLSWSYDFTKLFSMFLT